jgi:hypothetical protein
LSPTAIRATIEEALSRWSAVAPLRFVEVPDAGPMPSRNDYNGTGLPMMRFGHLPIDGPNNILAYAYYPGINGLAGDVLFDTAERWATHPSRGIDLLEVAVHEIGHALGLNHEPMPSNGGRVAIMNPFYAGRFNGLSTSFLYPDDINGIRTLYGVGVGWVRPLFSSEPNPDPGPNPGPNPNPAPDPAFAVQGSILTVVGTRGNDTFRFIGGSGAPLIEINGRAYTGSLAGITTVVFDGRGGNDTISLLGSDAREIFTLSPGTAMLNGGPVSVVATGMQTIVASAGVGDSLVVNGTAANNVFYASPSQVSLNAGGRRLTATGFAEVELNPGAGNNTLHLYDSPGNDVLTGNPGQVVLSGSHYRITGNAFRTVEVYASSGNDVANLTGSPGNDTFVGRHTLSRLSGPGYFLRVWGFDRVVADTRGGTDVALMFDSPGDDTLIARPGFAQMSGPGFSTEVSGIFRSTSRSTSGFDTAYLYGSANDDVFISLPNASSLRGEGFISGVQMFRNIVVDGMGGSNTAQIYGAGGASTTVIGSGDSGRLQRPNTGVTFTQFDQVTLHAVAGVNRRDHSPFHFTTIWLGMWL